MLLPTQLGLHGWPEWSLVLGRRVDYLSPTVFLTDIFIILTLLFWKKKRLPPLSYIVVFFVFAFVNSFFATNPQVAMYKWVKVTEFGFLFWYIKSTAPKFNTLVFFLSIGVLYSSLLAIFQFILGKSLGLWALGERTFTSETPGIAKFAFQNIFTLRPYATFPHPNVLGGFLAVLLPAITTRLLKENKVYYLIVVVLGTIALFLTFSRSAIVALVLGLGLTWNKKILALLLPLVLLITTTMSPGDESVVVREQLGSAAIAQFFRSPLIGVGLGNYLVELPSSLVTRQIYFLQPAHNIFLLLLSETGIIGLGVFMIIVFRVIKKITLARIALVTLLVLGLLDHYPITLQQGQILFTIMLAESTIGT